jgi:WD40 repeat protein
MYVCKDFLRMKSFTLLTCCCLALHGHAQTETHVTIETEGHMALVKNIAFAPDGKLLYSVSDDKTIRVWDVENKILLKTYRGYIGPGYIGLLAACAISPDGKTLAVGGILGKNHKDYGAIRMVDTSTGEIKDIITGHESSIVTLQFTPDGKFLVSGSNDGNVGLWNTRTLEGGGLTGHGSGVYGLAISPDNTTLVSADANGLMILWQLDKLLNEGKLDYKEIEHHQGQVRMAFSPSGEYFVSVSVDNTINLWNKKGKLIKQIDELLDPTYGKESNFCDLICVDFTADGTKIVVGSQKDEKQESAHVYAIPSGEKLGMFKQHTNTVLSVAIFGNDLVATSGGNEREIYLWNINTFEPIACFKGKGKPVWKVAAGPGHTIAIGNLPNQFIEVNNNGWLNKKFSLETMEYLGETDDFAGFTSEVTKTDSLEIIARSFTTVKIVNGPAIVLDPETEGKVRCATLTPDHRIVVGTTYGLYMYDRKGAFIQQLMGHSGEVYSLACAPDGSYLYSAGVDQTIKIWDLSEKGVLEKTYEEYVALLGKEDYNWLVDRYGTKYVRALYNQGYRTEIKPVASLFISSDNEWICWNRNNYYATSQHGSRYVGFHINKGFDKRADYLTFEQFDIKYNRPDILLSGLKTDTDTALIELYRRAYLKRLEKLNMNEADIDLEGNAAPKILLHTSSQSTASAELTLKVTMEDELKKLSAFFVTINGIPIYGLKGKDISGLATMKTDFSVTEKLGPGKNKIQVWCTNSAGIKSNRESIVVFSRADAAKPTLYLVGIGVSDYTDKQWNLHYAQKDVRDFVTFYTRSNSLYSKVMTDTLMNENATIENIARTLEKLRSCDVNDHVILYIAGHGVLDANLDYYLATHDMNFSIPGKKGFAYALLEAEMEKIPSRTKTIFIDACHGGELDKSAMELVADLPAENVEYLKFRSVGSAVQAQSGVGYANSFAVMKNMFTDLRESSGATIIASAGGAEFAFEGDKWQNGIFTYTLLEGLQSKAADLDHDGLIYLSELQRYLQQKVSERTGGRQRPISRVENLSNDYVFWK